MAEARCLPRAVDRGFPEGGRSGKSADRPGPDHMVQRFEKTILYCRERQWESSVECEEGTQEKPAMGG